MTLRIEPGRKVRLHFTIRLDEEEVAETTEDGEPVEFFVGDGDMDAGLEALILGMTAGERRSMEVAPGTAFTDRNEEAVRALPMTAFEDFEAEPGMVIEFESEADEIALPGVVLEVGDDEVVVDFNHPVSGRAFGFDVTILSVE